MGTTSKKIDMTRKNWREFLTNRGPLSISEMEKMSRTYNSNNRHDRRALKSRLDRHFRWIGKNPSDNNVGSGSSSVVVVG